MQTSLAAKKFWLDIMMIGVVSGPPLFFIFTVQFTQNDAILTPRRLVLLAVQPLLTLLLLWTNPYHRLVLSSVKIVDRNGYALLELTRGPWYLVTLIYLYALTALGLFILIRSSMRGGRLIRTQCRLILIGSLIPLLVSLYSQFNFEPLNGFDLSPASYGISGLIFLLAILRTGLMDLIPVARNHLIETMQDGVLVLDGQNRVVDINPAMELLLVGGSSTFIGMHAQEIFGHWLETVQPLLDGARLQTEILAPNNPARFLDLRATPLYDRDRRLNGRLLVCREITERKDVERRLRNANTRMQSQLIEIGILQSRLREQAIRDPLTNLFNRRYLEETLDRELARAGREDYPVSLIMIDIDHFKTVNDTHGHEAGDLLLKAIADLLAAQSRRGDFACRFGGEEFIVIMPNINPAAARDRAETLRLALNALRVPFQQNVLMMTISMGIASYPANGATRDAVLRAADLAMYAAKNAGRDHILSFDQLEPMHSVR